MVGTCSNRGRGESRRAAGGVIATSLLMAAVFAPERSSALPSTLAVGSEHVCVITTSGDVKVRESVGLVEGVGHVDVYRRKHIHVRG